MAEISGFIIGIMVVSIACGLTSYFIWEKVAGPNHSGKQVFFAFLSFGIGGLTGLLGGLPLLAISWGVAWKYQAKKEPAEKPAFESSEEKAS